MVLEKKYNVGELSHILRVIQGDITEQDTDAIVNAANSELILGAGVAGAIRKKGGPTIQDECNEIGHTPVGSAAITRGGNLKARYVIHAVGPIWGQHSSEKAKSLLANSITSSLKILEENNLKSITFPAISTGIFGFPKDLAAKVIKGAIYEYISNAKSSLEVRVCLFSDEDYKIFEKEFLT